MLFDHALESEMKGGADMAKMKKPVYLILALALIPALMVGGVTSIVAYRNNDSGSFDIRVFRDGDYHLQGELHFSDYETLQLPLDNVAGQLRLRLEQHGQMPLLLTMLQ